MSILLGILVGLALPVQTSVNNKLRDKVGTPYNSSLVSFIISTVFLACLLLVTGQGFHLPMDQLAGEPFWVWLGGLCGVVFLTANVILLTKLGSAETVILPVLGQLLMGLLVDSLGLFRAQEIPLTPLRAAGACLVLAGVVTVAWTKGAGGQEAPAARRLWLWRLVGGGRRDVQRRPDCGERPPGAGGGLPPHRLHGLLPGGAGRSGGAVRDPPGQAGSRPPGAGEVPLVDLDRRPAGGGVCAGQHLSLRHPGHRHDGGRPPGGGHCRGGWSSTTSPFSGRPGRR